ncbi:putative leucoanthocyanidin reductase [Dioscorea sansibarensis]
MANTLVIGAGGYIGGFLAAAHLESLIPTYLLRRPGSKSDDAFDLFKRKGATIIEGSFAEKEFMEKLLREHNIEVVICATGGGNVLDQVALVEAIKSVGTIKRFLPSEFGHDIDRANPVEPGLTFYNHKRLIRRAIEKAGIPYTYICCNSIASWPYYNNIHPSQVTPPLDYFQIYGDGSVGAYFVSGEDIGKITVKAANDPRTLNKAIHFRPASNLFNINQMASLWETKLGHKLPRLIVTAHHLLSIAAEMKIPESVVAALTHDIFFNGCQINFSLDEEHDLEACKLYPEITFQTLDHCFDEFALTLKNKIHKNNNNNNMKHYAKPLMIINNNTISQALDHEAHPINNNAHANAHAATFA